jgi:uncharacterized protein (TIGR02099 family)
MKRLGRAVEVLAWAVFFVLAALVLAVRFWLLPDIERYREEIVGAVSAAVGQPVRIGGLSAGWYGLNPHIHLRDVRIFDRAGREALTLPSIDNQLAWSSLLQGKLKLHSLAIDKLRLQVRRDAEGALYVAGIKLGERDGGFARWLLAQDEIVLRDAQIEWHDELRGAPPLELSAVNLRLRNAGERHAIGLSARPPAELGATLELRAMLQGTELADPAAWKGRLYAELGYTDLAAWRTWIDYPWRIDQGQGALRAWLTFEAGEVRRATADLALSDVAARFDEALSPLRLASLRGRLQGSSDNGRYYVAARDLAIGIEDGTVVAPSDFDVTWTAGSSGGGTLAAAAIELEPLARLAASLPLPERVRTVLAEVKPRGRLADARVEWRGEPQAPAGFTARAKFVDLAAEAVDALPGFAGITGSIDATESSARVVLATRKGELQLPRVFPEPRIALDFLDGLVEWERRGDAGIALRIESLAFSNADVSGNAHGTYVAAAGAPGVIDLSAQFNRADALQLARYLPHARLMGGEKTRDWLVQGVRAGQSSDVRVRIRGDLREFPFTDPARGHFSVAARIERGVLQYADGWPRIEDIQGELLFEGERMQIAGKSGSILGVALANVEVAIPRLRDPSPLLEVNGDARGATADFLRFIESSPVRRMTAGFTAPMSASGQGKLRLRLELPLKDLPSARVGGEYEFEGNELIVGAQLPPIEGAAGKVAFTESTLAVRDVQGRLFGGPVAISGGTQRDGTVQVVARGDATLAGTRALFDHPWRRFFAGQAPYVATVNIAKGRQQVLLQSSLQGVTSALPAPFSKRADEALPLQLELAPDEHLKIKLGRVLAAELVRRRQGEALVVQRAGVSLSPSGNAPLRLPERSGTLVYGSLPALDVDKWLPLFGAPDAPVDASALDVQIGQLDLYGKRLNDVSLRAGADAAGWAATIASQEIAGELSYRKDGGGRLLARLTRFLSPQAYPGAPERGTLEPKDVPTLDLVAERFSLRGKELGRIEIQGGRTGEDWRIDKLAMTNADATLAATGLWRGGAPARSQLDFELNASDAGQFLARVGYPNLVKGGKTKFRGNLAWNGDPSSIDYPSLSGSVKLESFSGQFLEIEPGIGKLISLMSLQALPRRIALDFRDVFSKGFGFDDIFAAAQVDSGVMTVKDFRMRGSSAQVQMSGEVDLAQETQNVRVRVVPSLGDSASLAIALVNPLLAIPAAIAQKILKDPLGHIFAFEYSVTGGWSDPKVAKLGIEARELAPQEGGVQ